MRMMLSVNVKATIRENILFMVLDAHSLAHFLHDLHVIILLQPLSFQEDVTLLWL